MNKEAVNGARSVYYGFFSKMLVFSESKDRFDGLKEALDVMIANPMDENSLEALKEIREIIELGGFSALISEYDDIFHDPSSKVVRNTASYYDEQVESGKKRLEVKNFLAKTKIRRDEKNFKENEDSVGFLVTFMHELVELIIQGEKPYETLQHCLFVEIINEFVDEYIAALYENEKSNAYKSVAVILNAFIEFERLYFDVSKPAPKEILVNKEEPNEHISDAEADRRKRNSEAKAADSIVKACDIPEESFAGKEQEGDL